MDRPRVVRSQVEPRLVERRRRVDLEQRRRRRTRLVAIAVIAATILAAIALVLSPALDLDRVEVSGNERLSVEELTELSGLELGEPLVSVDFAEAQAALLREPLVASAHLQRVWPGTVRIEIVEERPLVVVSQQGETVVVSSAGTVLSADLRGADLAEVVVERTLSLTPGSRVDPTLRMVVSLVAQMSTTLSERVERHVLDRGGALSIELRDGASVRVGRLEDVPAKLLAIETALEQIVPECLDVLDVREPTRVTVSRAVDCVAPEPTSMLDDGASGAGGADGAGA